MPPLSPAVSLAMQMHAQPGEFAVLLGSGISRGADIPTGWGVVIDLVRQAAAAHAAAAGEPAPTFETDDDVEQWWAEHGDGDLGYSQVLAAIAGTPPGRQKLLEQYFAPTDDGQLRAPSKAHTALAELVAAGTVRVILTTNFDRLTEQALAAQGVDPQVISRPEAVEGMDPLRHARATVIKLHGDYKDLTTRNTTGELAEYPPQWTALLEEIGNEYGLLISGWSADWDTALVQALEESRFRRYPLFWDSRSAGGDAARRLLAQHRGHVIDSPDADTLFTDLAASIAALDTIAEPHITTAIAVARVKRYLPDPLHRIDLHDLVLSRLDPIRAIADHYGNGDRLGADDYPQVLDAYQRASAPLLELLITGARFDDGTHQRLWGEIVDRLLALHRRPAGGQYFDYFRRTLLYPALLAFYAMSAADVATHHGGLMLHLAMDHTHPYNDNRPQRVPVATVLRADHLLTGLTPTNLGSSASRRVRADLRDLLTDVSADSADALIDDVEFRHALLIAHLAATGPDSERYITPPLAGQFRGQSIDQHSDLSRLGDRLQSDAAVAGDAWPWAAIVAAPADQISSVAVGMIESLDSTRTRW